MPCESDYMAASGQELESKRVCRLLLYLGSKTKKVVPAWIALAAKDYYGNLNRLDEATSMLCAQCRSLTDEEKEQYIYDAHNKNSRDLASWFERHQEWDERRVKEEVKTRKQIILKERALKKLSNDEMKALGLL